MERANSFGIGMIGIIFAVIPSLNAVIFTDFLHYLPIIILIGALGIILGGYIGSKLFKWGPYLDIPVALMAMVGFPGGYLLCEEVSCTVGRTLEEQEYLLKAI
ncbi:hypothetical protein [Metabacillus fastidiosus]|uniref:hypothetical protein n=1 Tax=Metabacillus fastidiosus TaxID=1458 RepID=UPI003D2CD6E2